MNLLALALLAALAAASPGPAADAGAAAPGPAARPDGVGPLLQEVDSWCRRFREERGADSPVRAGEALLLELRDAFAREAAERERLLVAMLDVVAAALDRRAERGPRALFDEPEGAMVELARPALENAMRRPSLRVFLERQVLLVASLHPPGRRAAAARALALRREEGSPLPLLEGTRAASALVREACLDALVGWDDPAVHRRMVDLALEESDELGPGSRWAERHFGAVRLERGTHAEARLEGLVRRLLASTEWRRASIGVSVARGLDPETAAPLLIPALESWIRRGEETGGTLRIQHEIAAELRALSGRNLGLRPERWQRWWEAVRAGDVGLAAAVGGDGEAFTRASFFGLDPRSDRVTFVLDQSGSMDSPILLSGAGPVRTRYEEAVAQLVGFLEDLGETGRFGVVLFNDRASIWRTKLQPASEANVRAVKSWLSSRRVDGGTLLREGVHRALGLDRRGRFDPEELETDTVVVLCDGRTTEGPGWVPPFLRAYNETARVRFHCLQIGTEGNGTLELLAERTGGTFSRVAP